MAVRSRLRNALVRGSRVVLLAAYWTVTRLTIYALLAGFSLYFVLNAGPFPGFLSEVLRSVLPGTLSFERLQVSPIPWKVDLLGVGIRTPDGRDVVTAGSLQVTLDLVPTVRFLAGHTDRLLEVAFRSIRLRDFWCEIAFDDRGELEFLRAFVWPPEPEATPAAPSHGPDVRLRFQHIIGERGRFHLSFPEWELWLEGLSLDTSLTVREDGRVLIRAPVVTFSGGVGRIHVAPDVREIPREVPLRASRVEGFDFDTDHFSIARARIALDGMDVDAAGSLAFPSGGLLAYDSRVVLTLPDQSPLLARTTRNQVHGPVTLTVQGRGDEHDPRFHLRLSSPGLHVAGLALGPVTVDLDGGRVASGPYAFHDLTAAGDSPWGSWRIRDAAFYPFGSDPSRPRLEAQATFEADIREVPRLLDALGVPSLPSAVPLPSRASVHVRASGAVSSGRPDVYQADVSARIAGTLSGRSLLEGPDLHVGIAAQVSWTPNSPDPGPLVTVRDLTLRSGADLARARGTLDLGAGTLRASGVVEKDLASLCRALGATCRGRVALSDVSARGRLGSPSVFAGAHATGLAVSDVAVQEVRASVRLERGTLALDHVSAEAQFARMEARSVRLDLRRPLLAVDGASVTRINLMWLPYLRPYGLRGMGQATADFLRLDPRDPWRTLALSGSVALPMVVVQNRRFQAVSATIQAQDGRVSVPVLNARLVGGGTLRAEATVDLGRSEVFARIALADTPLPFLTGLGDSLRGVVSLDALVAGSLRDPSLRIDAMVNDVSYNDISFGTIALAARRNPAGDLFLSSDRFLPRVALDPTSGLVYRDGRFTALVIRADITDMTPQDFWPSLPPRTFQAQFSGHLDLSLGLGREGALRATLTSPHGGLTLRFFDGEVTLRNEDRLELAVRESGDVTLSGLALSDGQGTLRACGEVMDRDGRSHLLVRGPVSVVFLRYLKDVFSSAQGIVHLAGLPGEPPPVPPPGCPADMTLAEGALEVFGQGLSPVFRGSVRADAVELVIRRLPDPIVLEPGTIVMLRGDDQGRMTATLPADSPLRGRLGDGRFAVDGVATFQGFLPDSGTLHLSGSGLRVASPGVYYLVLAPDVTARFADMASQDPGARRLVLAGRVDVTEGSYHRNFDVVRKAFSGVAGARVAQRESAPLATRAPWLAAADLDLVVTGSRLGVRSRLPFGSTDLEIALDLAVRGTLERPEVWNRVEVLPGGKVTYNVVRREFEVTRGTADFDGDPARPVLDVTARTTVDQSSAGTTQTVGGSRFEPETQTETGSFDEGVVVTLAVSGRFPDLDLSLTSNARDLDQTDLQYLLLTGTTQREAAEGRSGLIDLGLVTEDMTNLVTNLLLSPFVDAIRFGISPSGGMNAEVEAHLGSRLRFETQVLQETGGSRYRAGFQVRLTDRLFLEGRMRAVEQSTDPSEVGRRYEAKLRYRIPIE